jgi:hypothetical protein
MEWDPFLSWTPRYEPHDGPGRQVHDDGPSALDLWLIQVTYGVIASLSTCQACGAGLGRSISVVPVRGTHPSARWKVSVATRCQGWRRHPHHALATEGTDLLLGAFTWDRKSA